MALFFEFDFFVKSCRHIIGIVAWTWAIFVFCLSYIGRGNYYYNNNNNYYNNEYGPPTFYQTVFVPVLKVLLVAPSASYGVPVPQQQQQQDQVAPVVQPAGNLNARPIPLVNVPWSLIGAPGGGRFVYCAGCSPIDPSNQFVLPANFLVNTRAAADGRGASGVLPPQQNINLNSLGEIEPGKIAGAKVWDDGSIPVQQMALHDDGRYSFSYNTAHSARSEERKLDGMVSGSYSYTDPDGKHVQVEYTAGPQIGYKAYGDNLPPPQPVLQLPQPVQDTVEVQRARQEFLDTYAKELERIQRDQEAAAAAAATAKPEAVAEDTETKNEKEDDHDNDAVVTTVSSDAQDEEEPAASDDVAAKAAELPEIDVRSETGSRDGVDDQTDSVVISAEGKSDSGDNTLRASLPNPAYQISIPIGDGRVSIQGQQGVEQNQYDMAPAPEAHSIQAQQQGQSGGQSLQPYFYYVSVGGAPHFVTNYGQPGYNSPYPTSLKATLLGALPLAAVHNSQVPNLTSGEQEQVALNRPVYLDPENSVQEAQPQQVQNQQQQPLVTYNPVNLFNPQQQQMQHMQPMQQTQQQQIQQQQQMALGQLYPFSLGGGAHTFGYIPAVVFGNNNENAAAMPQEDTMNQQQQQQQPQQPQIVQGFNYPNTLGLVNHPQNVQVQLQAPQFGYPQMAQGVNMNQNQPLSTLGLVNHPQNAQNVGFNFQNYPQLSHGHNPLNPLGLVNYPQNVPGLGSYVQTVGAMAPPPQNVEAVNSQVPENVQAEADANADGSQNAEASENNDNVPQEQAEEQKEDPAAAEPSSDNQEEPKENQDEAVIVQAAK